jgi:arginyl-tRNA synthetase
VLRRRDGRLTYIAADVAYHDDKFNRPVNADKLITVLGPDHHGYIGRLTAVVAALRQDGKTGPDDASPELSEVEAKLFASRGERDASQRALAEARERLEVMIFQIVRFLKDGKPAPMRKRDGNIYAIIDLLDEIGAAMKPEASREEQRAAGRDVARFFYLMRHHDTALDFDLELAVKQSDENPVFYVQYAHARICSVIAKGAEAGLFADDTQINPLVDPREKALILKICDLPHEIDRCAQDYAVNRLANYATELARAYHAFYDACRVVAPEQSELSAARLALCDATRLALARALGLLGISAPERM